MFDGMRHKAEGAMGFPDMPKSGRWLSLGQLMGTLGRFPRVPLLELDRETWHIARYVWFLYSCEVRGDSEQVRISYLIVFLLNSAHLALELGIAPWERLEWAGT